MGVFRSQPFCAGVLVLSAGVAVSPSARGEEDQAAWPQADIDRPNTLPARSWTLELNAQSNSDFTSVSVGNAGPWGFSYGFTNEFQAGVTYLALVTSGDGYALGTGPLLANLAYAFYINGPLEISAAASAGYAFDQEQVAPLVVGVETPWNVLTWLAIGLNNNQFSFGLASPYPISFSMPLQFAVQPWPWLWVRLNVNLFQINIRGADQNTDLVQFEEIGLGPRVVVSPNNRWSFSAGAQMESIPAGATSFGASLQWTTTVTYFGNVPKQ